MKTGCMWAALRWLFAMVCGGLIVLLLARTCSFDPVEEGGREGREVEYEETDFDSTSLRRYTLENVPNPKNLGALNWVSNPDGILADTTVGYMNELLTELEDSLSIEVAVVALSSIGDEVPRQFAYGLFNFWGIGKSALDNGLLIQLVLDQREVTFETGYGLEGVLPDVVCYRIQQQAMIPWLSGNDFDRGMLEGVRAVVRKLYGSDYAEEELVQAEPSQWEDMDSGSWWVIVVFTLLIGGSNAFTLWWLCRYYRPKSNTAEAALDVRTERIFMNRSSCILLLFLPLWPAFLLCFLWYWLWQHWYLIRRSHFCPHCEKFTLYRLPGKEVAVRFSKAQCLENKLYSVVHRVYRCRICQKELEYHKVLSGSYRECKKCHTHAQKRVGKWNTLRRVTYSSEGLQQALYKCLFCGENMEVKRKIERMSRNNSSGGGHSSSGNGSGHLGGGHSGGGGASSRF